MIAGIHAVLAAGETHLPPPAVLGPIADFASLISEKAGSAGVTVLPPQTIKAWALRAAARHLLWREGVRCRLRFCGSRIVPRARGVTLFARPDRAYGRGGNVCQCGQSLLCPVCAARVAAFRAAEVSSCFSRVTALGRLMDAAREAQLAAELSGTEKAYAEASKADLAVREFVAVQAAEVRATAKAASEAAARVPLNEVMAAAEEAVARATVEKEAAAQAVEAATRAKNCLGTEAARIALDAAICGWKAAGAAVAKLAKVVGAHRALKTTANAAAMAAARAQKFSGPWEAQLITYTVPHTGASTLIEEFTVFNSAWRFFQSGAGSCRLRGEPVLGVQTCRELLLGEHGWHYHHHQCMYCRPGFDLRFLRDRWLSALRKVGRYKEAAEEHGFRADRINDQTGARYVAKIACSVEAAASRATGMELAGGVTKSGHGRNLMTLLADATYHNDVYARQKWLEAVRAIVERKVSSVRWSPGLRALVGMDGGEKTDEKIASEELTQADVLLGALSHEQWRCVCEGGRLVDGCYEPPRTMRQSAEFALVVAANQGRDAVNVLLANINAGALHENPAEVIAL